MYSLVKSLIGWIVYRVLTFAEFRFILLYSSIFLFSNSLLKPYQYFYFCISFISCTLNKTCLKFLSSGDLLFFFN